MEELQLACKSKGMSYYASPMVEELPTPEGQGEKPSILTPRQQAVFDRLSKSVESRARHITQRNRFFPEPVDESGNVDYGFADDMLSVQSEETFLQSLKLGAALGDPDAKELLES